jgi:hypothetical protein
MILHRLSYPINSFRVNCLNFFASAAVFPRGGLPLLFCPFPEGIDAAEEEIGTFGLAAEEDDRAGGTDLFVGG